MIKILLVEDMTLPQDSVTNVINGQDDMTVAGTASHAEALGLCKKLTPDMTLIGVSGGDGVTSENKHSTAYAGDDATIALVTEIRRELPGIKIVIVTERPDTALMDAAFNAGVHSFVRNDYGSEHLLYAIRHTITSDRGIYPGPV